MLKLLRQPSIIKLGVKHSLVLSSTVGFFVFVFLYVFEPFSLSNVAATPRHVLIVGYAAATFLVLLGNLIIVPLVFPGVFSENRWNLAKRILWQVWLAFWVGTGCFLVNTFYHWTHGHSSLSLEHFSRFQLYTSLTGILPIVVLNMIWHIHWLKQSLRHSEEISSQLSSQRNQPDAKTNGITAVVLTSESDKERYELNPSEILYASSEGNYTNVFIMTHDVKKLFIRGSLTLITKQLEDYPFLLRCHRAFMVNIRMVRRVAGNAQGLQLSLEHVKRTIPVARGRVREFKMRLRTCGYRSD